MYINSFQSAFLYLLNNQSTLIEQLSGDDFDIAGALSFHLQVTAALSLAQVSCANLFGIIN